MNRIGIFGGTFDPPHNGHLRALKAFISHFGLERVLVIPTGIPPHKNTTFTSDEDRLAMCRLAFSDIPGVELCDIELKKNTPSYTVETLTALRELYPDGDFLLFTGSDMFLSFEQWYRTADILRLASVAVFTRNGTDMDKLRQYAERLKRIYGATCYIAEYEPAVISSTDIRNGSRGSEVLLPCVERYISEHGLYRTPDEAEIVNILSSRVSEKRFRHCLGVADTAQRLAERYGADAVKARTAGLLHDVTKNLNATEQIEYADKYGIPLDAVERAAPQLIHPKTAEHFTRTQLHINDRDILSAIRWHTTGHAGITLLEKIIYTADFIEPTRDYSDVSYYRGLANEDLDRALFEGMKWIITDQINNNRHLHPDTVAMYNEYITEERKK